MIDREDILSMVRQAQEIDVKDSPNYIGMREVNTSLVAKGMNLELSAQIVSKMKYEVSQSVVDNDFSLVKECADILAQCIVNMHKQLEEDCGISLGAEMILNMAPEFNFTLDF